MTLWMVRAEGGALYGAFLARGIVSVGWRTGEDPRVLASRAALREAIRRAEPGIAPSSLAAGAGVVWRFYRMVEPGDGALTYDPSRRRYALGEIASEALHEPGAIGLPSKGHDHLRRVIWRGEIARAALPERASDALMPTLTLFQVRPEAERAVRAAAEEAGI